MGTRFGSYTELIPKGFVQFKGKPMIVRSIETLIDCGIKRIIIGTGYHKEAYEKLKKQFPQIETCYSPRYAETNSMYTLYNTRSVIGNDDFLLLESDLIFERKAITLLLESNIPDAMLITPLTKFQDQYYVEINESGVLSACSTNKDEIHPSGEFVGIHKLSNTFYKKMCIDYATIIHAQPKLGYEYELLHMSRNISPIHVLNQADLKWYEIDNEDDLKYAEKNIDIE